MKNHFILWVQASIFFVFNVTLFFFVLKESNLKWDRLQFAILFILIIILASSCIFSEGVFYLYFLRKGLNSQQFFLISSIYIISCLPSLLLFLYRFQAILSNTSLILFARIFNFLYVETVFLIVLSILTININYKKDIQLFLLSIGISAIIMKNAPISFSKSSEVFSVFIGGRWLLPGIGFSLCFIALGLYLIDLLRIKVRTDIIVSQILFLLGFLVSFHIILVFFSFLSIFIFSFLMVICLYGYLRGVFVHTL